VRLRHPGGTSGPVASSVRADVCIIGAGPAGIAVALGLLDRGLDVVLLESGTLEPSESDQTLNRGEVVGDAYAGLVPTRYRAWGGTVRLWNTPVGGQPGAKYVPLDPVDLSGSSSAGRGAWPIDWGQLVSWYELAQTACGLGPFDYEGATWATPDRSCLALSTQAFVTRVYQFGPARVFTDAHLSRLSREGHVRIFDRATVCGLTPLGASGGKHAAEVAGEDGVRRAVNARAFVLCAGAVENARLLLSSTGRNGRAPGDAGGWLGRGFMEHPRDRSMVWVPTTPELFRALRFYDRHEAGDGTIIGGRIGLTEDAAAELGNASLTLLPRSSEPGALAQWRARLRRLGVPFSRAARGGYGWSERARPERQFKDVQILMNLEQTPRWENRIELGSSTDRFGVPRPRLHWRWRAEDQTRLERLRDHVRDGLGTTGLGRIVQLHSNPPDPNAHHHAGTTRMHEDPTDGVVDPHGRVHGTDDLFVGGASVFPSAGFANPTLTIVALSLRLAETLGSSLG
jgi:choline dehydrogenase-like flavoprotein